MNAVGIEVSKGKSTLAIMPPFGEEETGLLSGKTAQRNTDCQ